MGEGWGEGEKGSISTSYLPLPLIPSHKGRGNGTFYETIKFSIAAICCCSFFLKKFGKIQLNNLN